MEKKHSQNVDVMDVQCTMLYNPIAAVQLCVSELFWFSLSMLFHPHVEQRVHTGTDVSFIPSITSTEA